MSHHHSKLSICGLGCALGVTWALGMLILGWFCWWTAGWGLQMVSVIGSVYIGFKPTFWGGIIGAIWGFVDWFIGGVIIAWVYNMCSCGKKCGSGVHGGETPSL